MPTGDLHHRRPRRRTTPARRPWRACRGYTYLLLLFMVALAGAALAMMGQQWQAAAQRERETELLFRGGQIRDALQRFNDLTPDGKPALPLALDELLLDRRGPEPRHHLRRLYADPFTAQVDWLLLRDAAGGIVGVRSRSHHPALRRHGVPVSTAASTPASGKPPDSPPHNPADSARDRPPQVGDWLFAIQPKNAAPRRSP
jgi:type II secretory pathway pseudopilin PulG